MRFISSLFLLLTICVSLTFAHGCQTQGEWRICESTVSTVRPFYIALRQNENGVRRLERFILDHLSNPDSNQYGQYLTRSQIDWYTRTDPQDMNRVLNWLTSNSVTYCRIYADAIRCEADVPTINRLFGVNMMKYTHKPTGYITWRSSRAYTLPQDLEDCIVFVDGISNKPHIPETFRVSRTDSPRADPGSVSREVLMRMYNISDTSTGPSVSVGAMEFQGGDGFSNSDLLMSEVANGVAKNPISDNHIIGTNNNPDVESELDVQVMFWASDDATLWYEDFDGWMYGWAIDFHNRKDKPEVVSLSWGWNEVDQCQIDSCNNETSRTYVNRCNIEFMKITASGTTILCASGDAGSPGRTNEVCDSNQGPYGWNHINPIFPGSSPWVISVGATYVEANDQHVNFNTPICNGSDGVSCATGNTEAETTLSVTYWTSGAGFERWTPIPDWQKNFVTKYLNSGVTLPDRKYFNAGGRAYPDVSAFGHNCIVHTDGGWNNVDGTSCASPIFAGVITHLNAFQKSRGKPILGFANPVLYKMYETMPTTFHDIVSGNSSCTEYMCCSNQFGFKATEGYDVVAGLGTPNVGIMKEWLLLNV